MCGFPSATALLFALSGVIHTAAAASCGNVTIANAGDADTVRRDCPTITGDLTFASELNETISLDGVETILGDIGHEGCADDFDNCVIPAPFSISSSTLTTLNGSLYFWYFNGLTELRFPNLTLVQGMWSIKRMHELTLLDLTKLARVGSFLIEARNLTTLRHEQLQGFTDWSLRRGGGSITFWAAAIDSIDSFYSAPLVVSSDNQDSTLQINSYNLPNVRHVTIGWARVHTVDITGAQNSSLGVTLGADNTTAMDIAHLQLTGKVAPFNRGAAVQNLTVGQFSYKQSETTTALDLPFDQVTSVRIQGHDRLQNLSLPAQALNWRNLSLSLYACPNLTLDAPFRTREDGTQEQTWYWPRGDIQRIEMVRVGLSNAFFDSFLANVNASTNATRVLGEFTLTPSRSHVFDCTPFDDLHNRSILAPGEYSCLSVRADTNSAGLAALPKSLVFGVAILAMVISCI